MHSSSTTTAVVVVARTKVHIRATAPGGTITLPATIAQQQQQQQQQQHPDCIIISIISMIRYVAAVRWHEARITQSHALLFIPGTGSRAGATTHTTRPNAHGFKPAAQPSTYEIAPCWRGCFYVWTPSLFSPLLILTEQPRFGHRRKTTRN